MRPGETVVDATFGAGGHARLLAEDLAGRGKLVADRPRPGGEAAIRPLQGTRGRRRPLPARRLRRRARTARGERRQRRRRSCSTSASRRCRSTVPSAGSPTRRTRRSTCGWIPPRSRRPASSSTPGTSASSPRSSGATARSATRGQIARAIVRRREERPFDRTGELVDVIKAAIPTPARFGEGHPAKRVFQALRIAVNDELGRSRARSRLRWRCFGPAAGSP